MLRLCQIPTDLVEFAGALHSGLDEKKYAIDGFAVGITRPASGVTTVQGNLTHHRVHLGLPVHDVIVTENTVETLARGQKFVSAISGYDIRIEPPKYNTQTSEWRVAA
jgi:hypothetical protein